MAFSVPDIMALTEVRTANEAGRAVMVLSKDLGAVLFANGFARELFCEEENGAAPPPVPARLRTLGPLLQEDGEAMMRLKARSGGLECWVTAHLFLTQTTQGEEIALLSAPVPLTERETRAELSRRLLGESTLTDGVLIAAGAPAADGNGDEAFGQAARAFLAGGAAQEKGRTFAFWRVASDLALGVRLAASEPLPERIEGRLAGLVDRWRSRGGEHEAEPGEKPEDARSPVSEAPLPAPEHEPAADTDATRRLLGEPVRFVWQIDPEGRFRQLSPEFAGAVGTNAADVVGLAFADVAEAFDFDETGEIGGLLDRRETWSGRSVYWPVEGTDRKVLVDLAALPTYDRERRFDGFRGFGIVRPSEHIADPEAIGLALGREAGAPGRTAPGKASGGGAQAQDEAFRATPFGQREAAGSRKDDAGASAAAPRRVISLEERRSGEALLSPSEEDAFKAIGAELLPRPRHDAADAPVELDRAAHELLAALPAALLVEMQGRPVFANAGFFRLTGHDTLPALAAAGGIDALFADADGRGEEDAAVRINRADGSVLPARVQMRRMRLSGRSALVFSFAPVEVPAQGADPAALEALQDELSELRSVLDTATDGILLLDSAGAVRSMNGSASSLLGVPPAGCTGRRFSDFLAPDSRRLAEDYLDSLRDGGLAGILNDGREVTAEVPGRGTIPLFLTIGRLAGERGWCVLLRDMAHWKRAEAELLQAKRQAEDASLTKSRFLANISHELRTPLNAIIGFADVMAAETYGPIGHERYLEYLRDIKRSGHHVLDLVNDLLDISKIEAGKVELAFEAVSLNEVVGEVVSLMQPQANRERVLVRSVLPGSVPLVVADRRTLRQIALNLIANAIRFTPAGGQIIASTAQGENGEVQLRFRDSGIGMSEREIEIALTPFQQVNAAGEERGGGTGLGLPLTKAMVEANRAQFKIDSAPGEGTLIEITFPAQRVLAH